MSKMNCREFEECGREPGGKNAKQLGVCSDTLFQGQVSLPLPLILK